MALQIQEATLDDLKCILELQKECYQTEAQLYNDFNIPPLTQTFESITDEFRRGTLFLKGVIDGQIAASVKGMIRNRTAYIGRLIVKSGFQNQQIGQSMMESIEHHLKAIRYELFTGHKSEKNLYLYKKLGYTEFKRENVNGALTLVYLEKNLEPQKLV